MLGAIVLIVNYVNCRKLQCYYVDWCYAEHHYVKWRYVDAAMLRITIPGVVILSYIMLNGVSPFLER